MYKKTNDLFVNAIEETDINGEEIILEFPMELIEEGRNIAQNTITDEKYSFNLYYDANQKDSLLFLLHTVGAIVEKEDRDLNILDTMMNMTQLAYIKRSDCVEKVRTNKGYNPFLIEDEVKINFADEKQQEFESSIDNMGTVPIMMINEGTEEMFDETDISVMSMDVAMASECGSPENTSFQTAQEIEVENLVSGEICCPGAEQWFKFTVPHNGTYTIYTTGALDTVGTLYDDCENEIIEVDDYEPCGKLNFRIIQDLDEGEIYYIRVTEARENTGVFSIKVTQNKLVESVIVNPHKIILNAETTYELPILNSTFTGINGAEPLSDIYTSTVPEDANEKRVFWWTLDTDVIRVSTGWHNAERYQTVTVVGTGSAKLFASDWKESGKRGECTVCVPKVTVISCSPDDWIRSSEKMGRDMAEQFGDEASFIVETPMSSATFESCWSNANECIVIHTHGSENGLYGVSNTGGSQAIITKNEIKSLPVNDRIYFIMMTACETASGAENDSVAYWLSKKINPDGIVIANTDIVSGNDTTFHGSNNEATWKVYKDGEILGPVLEVVLTMPSAYDIFQLYQ